MCQQWLPITDEGAVYGRDSDQREIAVPRRNKDTHVSRVVDDADGTEVAISVLSQVQTIYLDQLWKLLLLKVCFVIVCCNLHNGELWRLSIQAATTDYGKLCPDQILAHLLLIECLLIDYRVQLSQCNRIIQSDVLAVHESHHQQI